MVIRAAIAMEDERAEKKLVSQLIAFSLKRVDAEDVEIDISVFKNELSKLLKSFHNIDIAFISYSILSENIALLNQLYKANPSCVSVPVGSADGQIYQFLRMRPVGHLPSPSDGHIVDELCEFCVSELFQNPDVLQLRTKKGYYALSLSTVTYCQSDQKYALVVTDTGEIHRRLIKLDQLAELLPRYFVRIHQSFLVNAKRVASLDKSTWEIVLDQGERLPVSRAYRKAADELFKYGYLV